MVYSATSTVYAPAQRATGPGWVTGIGRTGAVARPWLGGAVIEGGNGGLGFTTFAAAAVLGAAAICLGPVGPPRPAWSGCAADRGAGRCDRLTPRPALPRLASDVIGRARGTPADAGRSAGACVRCGECIRKPCRPETLTNRASWDQNQEQSELKFTWRTQ
ncbi:hypothetical protein ACFYWN_02875 [Streptomyces sp. NPDC002917]|uniref:hypothetical protein n=1 Tax=Streptomyces sp. NPDC002917 TaxID=3364671 RepID=UPI0036874330